MSRKPWTAAELDVLRTMYEATPTAAIAKALGRTARAVYQRAEALGLKKSAAYLASESAGRIQQGRQDARMQASQFKAGQCAWNKGIKASTGKSATAFKPGNIPQTWVPVGTTRLDERDGYLVRKVSDTRVRSVDWRPLHVLAWEKAHGAIPPRHIVVFKPGRKTTDPEQITADAVECISRAENMRRNTYHRYGPEVAKLIQLRGAITRQINKRAKNEQDHQ